MRLMKVFCKKMLGSQYERFRKNLLVCVILFASLNMAEFHIVIAPFVLYLMSSVVTFGVMWQALSSISNVDELRHILMMPVCNRKLSLSYVMAIGLYAIATISAPLLAAVFALADCSVIEVTGSILCVINAIWMSAAIYVHRRFRVVGIVWAMLLLAGMYFGNQWRGFIWILVGNIVLSIVCVSVANVYDYIEKITVCSGGFRGGKRYFVWRYILRYLYSHKNYVTNTFAMWGVAVLLPKFLGELGGSFVLPVGFAILTLNTPLCILISCDRSLEEAVKSMPGQIKKFMLPYAGLLFCSNLIADIIFLISWRVQIGMVTLLMVGIAIVFASLSALGSVTLEWFCPLRNWKIESDLWHHPRKYVVPGVMMLIAGVVGLLL